MKTNTVMKNEIVSFLAQLGLAGKYLINGFIGGFVWSVYTKSNFWESVRRVIVGGLVSGYTTPFIVEKTSVKDAGFISFVVGMIGMVLIDYIYKWLVGKLKLLFSNQ
jgi:hypothetical protein